MTRFLFHALGSTALALGLLFASLPPAFAGQTINVTGNMPNSVKGNSPNANGAWDWDDTLDTLLDPNNNTVNIRSGTVQQGVYGGHADSQTTSVLASHNEVNISGGAVEWYVKGGYAFTNANFEEGARATHNTVNITSGTVQWEVYGGYAQARIDGIFAEASRNSVTIADGNVIRNVSGGRAESAVFVSATDNAVSISGGTVRGDVFGGWAELYHSASPLRISTASNNTVTITDGEVVGRVVGGYLLLRDAQAPGSATGNTVFISGTPNLTNSILYGGFVGDNNFTNPATGVRIDARSGNKLRFQSSELTVAGLKNFEFLHFYLPNSVQAGDTMLFVTDTANIEGSKFDVGVQRGPNSLPLRVGETVTLIDASDGDLIGAFNGTVNGRTMGGGIIYGYEFLVTTADEKVMATATNFVLDGSNKAYSEGFASSVTLVTQGGDMIAGPGMSEAMDATQGAEAGVAPVLAGFGAVSGGSMRINSGSHVDMRSVSLVAGFAWGRDFDFGRPTLGAFFEYGTGSYDTYNSFAGSASVKGKGDTYYYGGGILGRMDFADTGPGRFYTEGSFRAGRIHNDYKRSDIGVSYDFSTPYYGFHLGAGYIWNINEQASLDLYGKYFWTRVQGETVHLSAGDSIKFKDADSSRLRLGGRFAYAINEHVSPYIGAAYEHEFDGKARATTAFGDPIPAPSLRGDTGIGELGLTLRPSLNLPLSFDLGVQGYTGKREGVTGSLQIRFTF